MTSKYKLLIEDSDINFKTVFTELLAKDNVEVLSSKNIKVNIYETIAELVPDIVVIDYTMPGLNLNEFNQFMKSYVKLHSCLFVATFPYFDEKAIMNAINSGAVHYFVKENNITDLVRATRGLIADYDSIVRTLSPILPEKDLLKIKIDTDISEILSALSLSVNLTGYHYIKTAVKLAYFNPDILSSMTKELYTAVAENYETEDYKLDALAVSRAINNAISRAYSAQNSTNNPYSFIINDHKRKPSNKEFIKNLTLHLKEKHSK